MDDFTAQHLASWIESKFIEEEREDVLNSILMFIQHHPDVITDRSWSEIYGLATRG